MDSDERIRFWGQKVEEEGHDETKYGQKSTLGHFVTIAHQVIVVWIELDRWFCSFGESEIIRPEVKSQSDQIRF